MMVARTILRMLAVRALSNNFTAPYPTIANAKIYDSRLDDFDVYVTGSEDPVPRVGVYTANQKFEFGGGQAPKIIQANNDIEIMIEISVFGFKSMDGEIEGLMSNDQYLSAKLDILETQIFDALFRGDNEHTKAFRDFVSCIMSVESVDDMGAEGQHKIAMRTLILQLRVKQALCNERYDPDTSLWIDLYPELKNLITCSAMQDAIYQIPVNNTQNDLDGVDIDINSSTGVHPDTITKVKVNLDE